MANLKYKGVHKTSLVLNADNTEAELVTCACGNEVFYFTTAGDKICAGCYMTEAEALAAKAERDAQKQ